MNALLQPSEGSYLYLLGLVIIATQPQRFWLGMVLAGVPLGIAIGRRTIARGGRRR